MTEWLIELAGHQSDLDELTKILTTSELSVVKLDNAYYLKSMALHSLNTDQQAYGHAKTMIDQLNGIGGIYVEGYQNVSLSGGVAWEDEQGKHRSVFVEARSALHARASMSVPTVSGVVETQKAITPADNAMAKATQEEVVSRALRFFSKEKNWSNLYKVVDAIREDVGSLKDVESKGWVPGNEINRFTGTANNYSAVGDDSRHGFAAEKPMRDPMMLSEAVGLIRTLLAKWLESMS